MIKRKPYEYQDEFLKLARNRTRIALFWQMRLGKSPTCVWWLKQKTPQPERVLIICPKSVIPSWKEELKKFNQPFIVLTTANKDIHLPLMKMPIWVITNYECLRAKGIFLKDAQWDAVICDESTKIANHGATITHLFSNHENFPMVSELYLYETARVKAGRTQLRAILTGTPAPEGYQQYFYQFQFLFGKMGPYHNLFQYKHDCLERGVENPNKLKVKFTKTPWIAKYLENNSHELTRAKLKIELPQIYEKRYVEMSAEHRKVYDDFEDNWYVEFAKKVIEEGLGDKSIAQLSTQWATVAQNYLHQLAIGFPKQALDIYADHKLKEVVNLLKTDLKDEKLIIWCQYLRDIDVLKETISNRTEKSAEIINGSKTTEQIERTLANFRGETFRKTDVLICQIKKASMGMDLSIADTQIFFSRSWSALDNQQAIERLVHPEKLKNKKFDGLLTIDIITDNSIDEDVHKALVEKKSEAAVYKYFLERTKKKGLVNA